AANYRLNQAATESGSMSRQRAIYACDIGSCRKGNFAWARVGPEGVLRSSTNIEVLVSSLQQDLGLAMSIALGFEAPLFIPVPDHPNKIAIARDGEGIVPSPRALVPVLPLSGSRK